MTSKSKKSYIETLIPIIILFVSTTGWYSLDYVGMKAFWIGFFLLSFTYAFLILKDFKWNTGIKRLVTNRYNIILILYTLWVSISYLYNYNGRGSLLYTFKVWFMIIFYVILTEIYIDNITKENKKILIHNISKYIFILGVFHSVIGLYQFITLSNKVFGVVISDWHPYNPAAMYGNVNGFGTYLFISIICGFNLFIEGLNKKSNKYTAFLLIFQMYMIYLTVSRTSIVSLIAYFIFILILFFIKKKELLVKIFSKNNVILFIICNLIMLSIIKLPQHRGYINELLHKETVEEERTAENMLKEKNSKGFNNRSIIWNAVGDNYTEYICFGDGLKYNVLDRIDVINVISERSEGVDRISYHNTLVRYFASNGVLGLVLFLAMYFAIPLKLFINMIKRREVEMESSIIIILLAVTFMYMQMEEVYMGEIGFMSIITNLVLGYGSTLLTRK